jgi:hypothetical protein
MHEGCTPYQRKSLYLLLTIPMLGMYVAIAVFLWNVGTTYFLIYCGLFVLVAITQSYVCIYFQCPYVGKFAPCVGGFCLPSSQIARLLKHAKRSGNLYNIVVSLAFAAFLGIILLPMYFLYVQNVAYFIAYIVIVTFYAGSFLGFICPVCGTRHVCPGGQTSTKLLEIVKERLA